jgi:ribitol-5-phosphate 2-dehydrogenase (NADP+) / D-ribitol-5-phosphate cytidylyltransferase
MKQAFAIILAAGSGERFGHHIPKQFLKIAGKTLVEHTIEIFEKNPNIQETIIVVHPQYQNLMEEILLKNNYSKVRKVLNGGSNRRESSLIGLNAIENEDSLVLIHDAVRPFLSNRIINDCIKALEKYDAVDVAIFAADTIIKVDENRLITEIPNRKAMMRGQTPQAFKTSVIKKAHLLAIQDNDDEFTDDCGLIMKYQLTDVYIVAGEITNIKVTYPEDIFLADKLFQIKSLGIPLKISLAELKDKVIVIFGASRGIGQAIANIAKEYQAKVYGFSRQNNVNVSSFEDVSKSLDAVYADEKQIDYVVNTAGILRMGKIETRDMANIVEEININYLGSINIVKASIPFLRESKGGMLLFTSSSYTRGRALYSIYSSTKAAIVNLAQAFTEELLSDNIKINVINPQRTNTTMRKENFGEEPEDSLLKSEKVAEASLKVLLSDLRGQVIDVRKDD